MIAKFNQACPFRKPAPNCAKIAEVLVTRVIVAVVDGGPAGVGYLIVPEGSLPDAR